MARPVRLILPIALAILVSISMLATPAFAKDDRVSFAKDIVVASDSTAGDLVCILCSVKVHGNVDGDIVAIMGNVSSSPKLWTSGDVVVIGGDMSVGESSSVHGSVVVLAGSLDTAPGVSIVGDREVLEGREWLLLPLAPIIIFIGIVWLIVWFVGRNRYRFPMYPQGRGY